MDNIQELESFCALNKIVFAVNEPMNKHTTFKIGGNCDIFLVPKSIGELEKLSAKCNELKIPVHIIGNGSNLLVSDAGVEGAVISLGRDFEKAQLLDGCKLYIPAGMSISSVCKLAQEQGFTGLEFAYGIPGSMGGAVYMNAGAYGGEIAHVAQSIQCMDSHGRINILTAEQCEFAYRSSRFQKSGEWIIGVVLCMKSGDKTEIQARMNELMTARKTKQPIELPSAGSTFKRPKQGAVAAAGLIESCGLKGLRMGGAQVSEKHSGFIVNIGGATAKDVLRLAEIVCTVVQAKTGTALEHEIEFLGRR